MPWTAPPATAQTRPGDRVTVTTRRAGATSWHTDPDCPKLATAADRHTWEGPLEQVTLDVWQNRRSTPCATCARPLLLQIAVRSATEQDGHWVILGCPSPRWQPTSTHRGCPRDRELAAFAVAEDLPAYTTPQGYQLTGARIHPLMQHAVAANYLLLPTTGDVPRLTSDILTTAWHLLPTAVADKIPLAAGRTDKVTGQHWPGFTATLDVVAADLIHDLP